MHDGEEEWLPEHTNWRTNFPPHVFHMRFKGYEIPLYKNRSFLHQKYVVERLSILQISKLIFSSRSTVATHLREFGIEIRRVDEAHALNPGQLALGEKKVKNRILAHKRELEVLTKIKDLKDQGLTYREMASVLNTMGIPTKNRKKWHPATIIKLLKRKRNGD